MDDGLLDYDELAARLKISKRQVFTLLKAGVVPARLVGRVRRFYWPEVLAALPRATAPCAPLRGPAMELVPMLKERVRQQRRMG